MYRILTGRDGGKAVQAEGITFLETDEMESCLMMVSAQTDGSTYGLCA